MELKYTVLTYIFGGYERVHEVKVKDPNADYILVTDDPTLTSKTWRVVLATELDGLSVFDKCYAVRFFPFAYADTDMVVRIDGSIEIRQSLMPLIEEMERGRYDRCLMIHPHRNKISEEYDVWVKTRRYPREQAKRCMWMMKMLGYDFNYRGLYQGCFEVVRRNKVNSDLNATTYALLKYLGEENKIERIDQTITSFVANKLFAEEMRVLPVSEDLITNGKIMQWYLHNSNKAIPRKSWYLPPMLFDKPCQTKW